MPVGSASNSAISRLRSPHGGAPATRSSVRSPARTAPTILAVFRDPPTKISNAGDEHGRIDGLGEVQLIASRECLPRVFRTRVGREREGWRPTPSVRRESTDLTNKGVAVDVRHADITHDYVGLNLSDGRHRFDR